MSCYTQLTQEERYQIYVLKKAGHTQQEIARILDRSPSTISRELGRNQGGRGYRPQQAHGLALARRSAKAQSRISDSVWRQVEALIRQDWSPEQVSERLRREQGIGVSHEWIYQHLYADKVVGGDLHTHLRCRKQRRKRYGVYSRRGVIPNQVRIDQRPGVVQARRRIGDWEGDTVIGAGHRGALVTLVERKSRFTVIGKVKRKTAALVRNKVVEKLKSHQDHVHTLTVDNGKEFADHEGMAEDLQAKVYFCHPYASWERGLNENTNGLIRQYFPKHRNLREVADAELQNAMQRLNHRPRKKLDFKTPYEVFFQTETSLTLALQS